MVQVLFSRIGKAVGILVFILGSILIAPKHSQTQWTTVGNFPNLGGVFSDNIICLKKGKTGILQAEGNFKIGIGNWYVANCYYLPLEEGIGENQFVFE